MHGRSFRLHGVRLWRLGLASASRELITPPTCSPSSLSSTMNTMSETVAAQGARSPSDTKQKENDLPNMPPHWVFERGRHPDHWFLCWRPLAHFIYRVFCVIGLGHSDLGIVWKASHPKCPVETWEAGRDSLRERIQHINVVVRSRWSPGSVSLVLTTISGLGWFALYCDGSILHDGSSWELENIAIYTDRPLSRPPRVHWLFDRRPDRGICRCVCHSQVHCGVVPQGSSSLDT